MTPAGGKQVETQDWPWLGSAANPGAFMFHDGGAEHPSHAATFGPGSPIPFDDIRTPSIRSTLIATLHFNELIDATTPRCRCKDCA